MPTALTLRLSKGTALTFQEVDDNFTNLRASVDVDPFAKLEFRVGASLFSFQEPSPGVLQLGDANITYEPASPSGPLLNVGLGVGGKVVADYANFSAIYSTADPAFVTVLEMATFGLVDLTVNDGFGNSVVILFQGTGVANEGQLIAATTIDLGSVAFPWRTGYFGTSVLAKNLGGTGFIDADVYKVGGVAGLATFSGAVTNLTVVNGIVTAAS